MFRKLALARLLRADAETLETDAAEIAALLGGDDAFCLAMARNMRSQAQGKRNLARALEARAAKPAALKLARAGYIRADLTCGLTAAVVCVLLWLAAGNAMVSPGVVNALCSILYR